MSRHAAPLANDLLTTADAARILGLSADMVRLLARDGRLRPAAETVRGLRLFRREDVDALADERAGHRAHHHIVQFYESADFLCSVVADFLAEGLKSRGPILIIASEARQDAVLAQIAARGYDVEHARTSGQLTVLGARETLDRFMATGSPDAKLFRKHVGNLIEERSKSSRVRLRVYGEMVDLLGRDGLLEAAIRVEELLNDLARENRLSRLCAYAMNNFQTGADSPSFERICELHTRVVPTERYVEGEAQERLRKIALLEQQAHALRTEMDLRMRAEDELRAIRASMRVDGPSPAKAGAVR
jgi:excisionase family DNA binding protein